VFFELNGQPREVTVADLSAEPEVKQRVKAEPGNANHVGASMPGMVVSIAVQPGEKVKKGQALLNLEAMKMQTTIHAERDGTVDDILVTTGSQVETGDLLLTFQ